MLWASQSQCCPPALVRWWSRSARVPTSLGRCCVEPRLASACSLKLLLLRPPGAPARPGCPSSLSSFCVSFQPWSLPSHCVYMAVVCTDLPSRGHFLSAVSAWPGVRLAVSLERRVGRDTGPRPGAPLLACLFRLLSLLCGACIPAAHVSLSWGHRCPGGAPSSCWCAHAPYTDLALFSGSDRSPVGWHPVVCSLSCTDEKAPCRCEGQTMHG